MGQENNKQEAMTAPAVFTLVNPQTGHLAFKLMSFEDNSHFDHIQRHNYFSVILVTKGEGKLKADFSEYDFSANTLLCFSPYQPFMLQADGPIAGVAIYFHTDFFCILKHYKEVSCNGVLFNNIYQPPTLTLSEKDSATFLGIVEQMRTEMQNAALAQYELLVAYLKIYLITAARLKVAQDPQAQAAVADNKEPFILQNLKDAIETHYRTKHRAGEYAHLLNISPRALAKISKAYFNKTITHLIAERIVIEAKRELYLTAKPVKAIAYELGFEDEYYFSRFFKTNAEVSPQLYRDTVGFARGEA
jgi:AraC family transcriptional regulator, transcriptional activator of pobA